MYKVKCEGCGDVGFTAAPRYVKCLSCGGKHRVIPFDKGDLESKGKARYRRFQRSDYHAYTDHTAGNFTNKDSGRD